MSEGSDAQMPRNPTRTSSSCVEFGTIAASVIAMGFDDAVSRFAEYENDARYTFFISSDVQPAERMPGGNSCLLASL